MPYMSRTEWETKPHDKCWICGSDLDYTDGYTSSSRVNVARCKRTENYILWCFHCEHAYYSKIQPYNRINISCPDCGSNHVDGQTLD
jgi:rRNA maturation endonuclease Nob1